MSLPVVPIVLLAAGAGVLAYGAFSSKSSGGGAAPGGALPPGTAPGGALPPGTLPGGTAPGSSAAMPAHMRIVYEQLLAHGQDPEAMEVVAAELDKYGFTTEANILRARAAQLRAAQAQNKVPPPPPPPPPVVPVVVQPSGGTVATVTAPSGLNVRSQPNETSTKLGALPFGTQVTVLRTGLPPTPQAQRGWSEIQSGNLRGFVSSEWLSGGASPAGTVIPAGLPVPSQKTVATVTTQSTGLNVRSQPNTSAAIVASAAKGSQVVVLNWNAAGATSGAPHGWAQIMTTTGATGFASKEFLAPVESPLVPAVFAGEPGKTLVCKAPSGCLLRRAPNPSAPHITVIGHGERVVATTVRPGPKSSHASPGRGGWALVTYAGTKGWMPSEWLVSA